VARAEAIYRVGQGLQPVCLKDPRYNEQGIDGWESRKEKPCDQVIDLAA
jgi:hypothetical protein